MCLCNYYDFLKRNKNPPETWKC